MRKHLAVKLAESFVRAIKKHSPAILTGLAVAGTFGAVIVTVNATPKAERLIERRKKELGVEKLPPVEVIKTAWKPFVPVAAVCVTSAACGIASNAISAKRGAMLGAALTLSETALLDYQRKAVEVVGESGEKAIREAVAKEKAENNPVSQNTIINTGVGDTLCYDTLSGRYFLSDANQIKKAEYEFNKVILYDSYGSLNEFYDLLGLKHIALGDDQGWNSFNGGKVTVKFGSILTETDTPCMTVDYYPLPKHDYQGR